MVDYWPLLVHDPFGGDVLINRQLRPRAVAQPVDRGDFGAAVQAVVGLCNRWAGGAMPLMPVTPVAPVDDQWARILTESSIDAIENSDLLMRKRFASTRTSTAIRHNCCSESWSSSNASRKH